MNIIEKSRPAFVTAFFFITAFIFSISTPSSAYATLYHFTGSYETGPLAPNTYLGTYEYDDQLNQISTFNLSISGFTTEFSLSDFTTFNVTDFDEFLLTSSSLEFEIYPFPTPPQPTHGKSWRTRLKWYDWSVWDDAERLIVPEQGESIGNANVVPEPSSLSILVAGFLALALRRKRALKRH